MKGVGKGIIIGLVIVVIGIIILVTALALNGWKFGPDITFNTETYTAENNNGSVAIELNAGSLYTEFYDGDKIIIEYPVADGFSPTISESDGKLTFRSGSITFSNFFRWWSPNIPKTVVKLPAGTEFNLDVDLNAGSVNVAGGNFKEIDVHVNAGTINGNGIVCSSFDGEVNAGAMSINGLTCQKFDCNVSAGSTTVKELDCSDITAEVSAGSLNIKVNGAKAEYTIYANRSAGSCNVENQLGSVAGKKLEIEVSAGSANVSFSG